MCSKSMKDECKKRILKKVIGDESFKTSTQPVSITILGNHSYRQTNRIKTFVSIKDRCCSEGGRVFFVSLGAEFPVSWGTYTS